jgi:protein-disulfide isomerase
MRGRLFIGIALAACALGAGLIATSVFSANQDDPGPAPMQQALADETDDLLAGIPQQGAVLGRRDAPVTLVEFADPQCPYCAQWSATAFDDIVTDYIRPGKVRLVFGGLSFLGADLRKACGSLSPRVARTVSGTSSTSSMRTRGRRTAAG